MSLSTSNFKTELKVIGLVLLVLAGCELAVRKIVSAVTWDVRVSAISRELVEGEGARVLVLGNSLVREGIDTDVLERELERRAGGRVRVRQVSPLNTSVSDWYYAFKQHFADASREPEVLVICFARNHLEDAELLRASVAQYYSDSGDIPEIFSKDVKTFDKRADFLLSALSVSFANRTSVERRVLEATVPRYREAITRINKSIVEAGNNSAVAERPTYNRFEDLIKLAASRRVKVIVVAMPVREPYTPDAEIQQRAEAVGAVFIDCRDALELKQESFEDEMHLTDKGAAIFSQLLSEKLAGHLALIPRRASDARSP